MRLKLKVKRILAISLILISCNPVKSVLKDPKKFDIVKDAVIRSGACVNDTITIQTSKDSIVYKDSIIESKIKVPCKDFDTTFADGTSIKISSGVLYYKTKAHQKETSKIITVTNSIRDKSYEDILKSDITKRDSAIAAYIKLYSETHIKLKDAENAKTKLRWRLFGVIAIFLVWTFRWSILKLVNPL